MDESRSAGATAGFSLRNGGDPLSVLSQGGMASWYTDHLTPISLAEDFCWDNKYLVLLRSTYVRWHKLPLMWEKVLRETESYGYLKWDDVRHQELSTAAAGKLTHALQGRDASQHHLLSLLTTDQALCHCFYSYYLTQSLISII